MEATHKSGKGSYLVPRPQSRAPRSSSLLHFFSSSPASIHCSLFTVRCFCDPNHGEQEFPPFRGVIQ